MKIFLIILISLIVIFLLFVVIPTLIIANYVYKKQLVRTDKEKWGRVCSCLENEEQVIMWNASMKFKDEFEQNSSDVEIENEGFKLVGKYYDFGGDNAVIFIAGRAECLYYALYYAKPYQENNINVLVIDSRSHGESDGTYNTVGLLEEKDIIAWAKFLHDEKLNKKIMLHGICIGSATSLYAITDPTAPDYFAGMVADGMYKSFYDTFKHHMKDLKKPTFPTLQIMRHKLKKISGKDIIKYSPYTEITKLEKPLLMLHSEKDIFSLPDQAKELFERCKTSDKQLIFFPKGAHSHVRINNTIKYDEEVTKFIKKVLD
jgi:dipeptidyl aminopeptidase/acylaminoacyl peptidase